LPVVDVSVHHAVIVAIGPDSTGDSADCRADHRAGEDSANAAAGNRGNARAKRGTTERAGGDGMGRRIIALRLTGIILAVVDITIDIAVIVVVGPYRAREPADRCTDGRAFDDADTRRNRADCRAADTAYFRAIGDFALDRHAGAGGKRHAGRQRQGQNGFPHRSFTRLI
jgi:hypothetical protein